MKCKTAIICDIDGTLADVEHRRHHLPNWDAFFKPMDKDPCIEPVASVVQLFHSASPVSVILCSARPESYRKVTEDWLLRHNIFYDHLFLRADGDYREDVVVKRQMLAHIRSLGYEIEFVIDDRQSVVNMWREEGLVCLQAAPGDFDKPKVNVHPGHLHMMVGPSGAGKSTFIKSNFMPAMVVSSDQLRQEICGDMMDQSQNERVFATLHELVKTRITLGLDTVVDATNLKNKDRKAILDILPDLCSVTYHVINRSMADKTRDAGWRSTVKVKGMPLIQYHENVFQSNLKDITRGDNDKRVTVIVYPY